MNLDALLGVLLAAAICALLAFLAALLLRTRQSILGYLGAGLLGQGIGLWLAGVVNGTAWPYTLSIAGAGVHLLWTFVGALIVLLVHGLVSRSSR